MKNLIIVFVLILFCACHVEQESNYFEPGELSEDYLTDSVSNKMLSEKLLRLKESPLREWPKNIHSIRLLVEPAFFNSYCIRVEKNDSTCKTTFKILGDNNRSIQSGLTDLTLIYESKHKRMDSLLNQLHQVIDTYDFYPGYDMAGLIGADGVSYLLEQYNKGKYQVVVGWSGGEYKGKQQLFEIIDRMHSFVPMNLVPNANPKNPESAYFTIFRRDSRSVAK